MPVHFSSELRKRIEDAELVAGIRVSGILNIDGVREAKRGRAPSLVFECTAGLTYRHGAGGLGIG